MKFSTPRSSKSYMTNGAAPKLSIETAREIKRRSEAGATNPQLAKEYGVKTDTIRRAIVRAAFASGGAE